MLPNYCLIKLRE